MPSRGRRDQRENPENNSGEFLLGPGFTHLVQGSARASAVTSDPSGAPAGRYPLPLLRSEVEGLERKPSAAVN